MVDLSRFLHLSRKRRLAKKPAPESAAQYLPSLIIKRIAYYVSTDDSVLLATGTESPAAPHNNKNISQGSSSNSNNNSSNSNSKSSSTIGSNQDRITRAAQPMVAVCRNWRVSVLSLFYSHFVLDINSTAVRIAPCRKMVYEKCDNISNNVRRLAKSVYITAPYASIFTGHILRTLRANHLSEDVTFAGVSCLYLNFYTGLTEAVQELADYEQHIAEFSQLISNALFPNADEYHFQISSFTDTDDSYMVGTLLTSLIGSGTRRLRIAEYVHSSSGVRINGLLHVSGLTHIRIQDYAHTEDCVELVRRNAPTLVSVDLGCVDAPEFLPQLVTGDDGSPITYPNLRNLAIHMKLMPKDFSAVFPVLKHLNCTTGSLRIANVEPKQMIY
ncbi:hypothetical protein IW140_001561 [Coemansia sp. RSA 1813]|nr:hypothetical protein EV178_001678 [Coemansia sp. RSA 1646]KAJ2091347.1 hypothetical protein IW138_002046 [Coemansia sp. RSA 986]KAJ2216538.1 hypothetical protein EV179_001333 [Coemansia sp. RSA 487]KAJ2571381.1 hypothetical protein IW140_001561 [Coemansia sp. RSA 1813]